VPLRRGRLVGLAIDIENRYKGLRAPHKIKFGVSGCTRECAEAQGKDVGIIATERAGTSTCAATAA
jgi:nitrite reductase (NADH) large subunit